MSNQPKQYERIIYQPIAAVREPATVLAAVLVEYGLLKESDPKKDDLAWTIVRAFGEAGFFVTRR
jgi:hypothetical protein